MNVGDVLVRISGTKVFFENMYLNVKVELRGSNCLALIDSRCKINLIYKEVYDQIKDGVDLPDVQGD